MFLPRFNFPEETFLRIGHKVIKTCSCENFFHEKSYNIYNTYNRNLRNYARSDKFLNGGNLFTTPFNYIF